jgi:hypothetical protein
MVALDVTEPLKEFSRRCGDKPETAAAAQFCFPLKGRDNSRTESLRRTDGKAIMERPA